MLCHLNINFLMIYVFVCEFNVNKEVLPLPEASSRISVDNNLLSANSDCFSQLKRMRPWDPLPLKLVRRILKSYGNGVGTP